MYFLKENQTENIYQVWRIDAIKGNRVYCSLVANDMYPDGTGAVLANANFTQNTIGAWRAELCGRPKNCPNL